jgi:hypothetical protein
MIKSFEGHKINKKPVNIEKYVDFFGGLALNFIGL